MLVLSALAAFEVRTLNGVWFALTLVGMPAAQGAANLIDDYFDDQSGLDADPEFAKNAFPLGSRVIQTGALSKRGVARFAAACAGIALVCGAVLESVRGDFAVAGLALTAGILGYFYTAPPLRIAYRGAGEPVTFLLFGPLSGIGTYWVQTSSLSLAAALVATIVGLLAMAILYLHHFPQHGADRRHGKRTPIVRLGPAGAGRLVPWMLGLPFARLAAAIRARVLPPVAGLAFAALPFAWRASRLALASPADPRLMTAAFASGFALHFASLTLLAGALYFSAPG